MTERDERIFAVKWNKLQWRLGRCAPPNKAPNRHESAPHLSICRSCYSTGYDRDDTTGVTTWCNKCLGTGYVVTPGQEPPPDDLPKWHWFYQIGMTDSSYRSKKGYAHMREVGTPKMYLMPDFAIHQVSEVRLKKDDTVFLDTIEKLTQTGSVDKKEEQKRGSLLALQKFGISCTSLDEGKYNKLAEDRASKVEHRIGRTRGDKYGILKFSKPDEKLYPSSGEKFSKLAAVMDRSHGIEHKKLAEKMDSSLEKKKKNEDVNSSPEGKKLADVECSFPEGKKFADVEGNSSEEKNLAEEVCNPPEEEKFGKMAENRCSSSEVGQRHLELRGQLKEEKFSISKLSKLAEDVWRSSEIGKFSRLTEDVFSSLDEKFSKLVEETNESFFEKSSKSSEEKNRSFEKNLNQPAKEALCSKLAEEGKFSKLAEKGKFSKLAEDQTIGKDNSKLEVAKDLGMCHEDQKMGKEANSKLKVEKLAEEKCNNHEKQKISQKESRDKFRFLRLYTAVHSSAESESSEEMKYDHFENDMVEEEKGTEQVNKKANIKPLKQNFSLKKCRKLKKQVFSEEGVRPIDQNCSSEEEVFYGERELSLIRERKMRQFREKKVKYEKTKCILKGARGNRITIPGLLPAAKLH